MAYRWLGFTVLVIATLLAVVTFYGPDITWRYYANRALSERAQQKLSRCDDINWHTLLAVHSQDLDVPCHEPWLAHQTQMKANRPRAIAWLRDRGNGPSRGAMRANLALALLQQAPVQEPTWTLEDVSFHQEALAKGEPASWMAPDRAGWVVLAHELATSHELSAEARSWLLWSAVSFPVEQQQQIASPLQDFLGYPRHRLETWQSRITKNLPALAFTEEELVVFNNLSCALTSPCLHLWAQVVEARTLSTTASPAVSSQWQAWLNRQPPNVRRANEEAFRLWVDWVRKGPDPAARLISLPLGRGVGPAQALTEGATPATWLAMMQTTGQQVDLPVSITRTTHGLSIRVGAFTRVTTACLKPTPTEPTVGPPVTTAELVAGVQPPSRPESPETTDLLKRLGFEPKEADSTLICK